MQVIVTVGLLVIVILIFTLFLRKGFKGHYNLAERYLEEGREANYARRRDIEPEYFFVPDVSKLPLSEDSSQAQNIVLACSRKKMLRFPEKMTNIALKKAYGVANIELIAEYEENYDQYIKALIDWAETLLEDGENAKATPILEEAINLGSEYRKSYWLLVDLYVQAGDAEKLQALLNLVDQRIFADEAIKRTIITYIMEKNVF